VDLAGESGAKDIDAEEEMLILGAEESDNSVKINSYYSKINNFLDQQDLAPAEELFSELKENFSDSLDSLELNTIIEKINNLKTVLKKNPEQLTDEEITFSVEEEEPFGKTGEDEIQSGDLELAASVSEESNILQNKSDSKFNIEVNFDYLNSDEIKLDPSKLNKDDEKLEIDLSDSRRISKEEVDEQIDKAVSRDSIKIQNQFDEETLFDEQEDLIIRDIQEETGEITDSRIEHTDTIKVKSESEEDAFQIEDESGSDLDDEFEIEVDSTTESDEDEKVEEQTDFFSESNKDSFFDELEVNEKLFLNLESETDSGGEQEEPFDELGAGEVGFDLENDDILGNEDLFFEEEQYHDLSKNAADEIKAILKCVAELEKQKTSTVEKNMMEIFEEFKKGVNEKIGYKDFDTRYNLGIAYKEMGLIEEAIHEFLISSKSEEKFFDSAGLLGLCFKEKGLLDDALGWFQKALESKGRKDDEYLSIKYEILLTYKLKKDSTTALKIAREIVGKSPNFRDVKKIIESLS
jgi:hypothetical protein